MQDLHLGGRPSNAQFQYVLKGDTAAEVYAAADRLVAALRNVPVLADVNSDQQERGLSAMLTIDRDAVAAHGLSALVIDNALYDAFGQRQVSTIYDALNQYHVVLEAAPAYWQTPAMLNHLFISTAGAPPRGTSLTNAVAGTALRGPSPLLRVRLTPAAPVQNAAGNVTSNAIAAVGKAGVSAGSPISAAVEPMVPLSAVARWTTGIAPILVSHEGLAAATTLSFNLPPGVALGEAITAIDAKVRELGLPASVRGGFAGAAAEFKASQRNEAVLLLAALLSVYILLGILYESFVHPLTILSTLPSAGLGAVLALYVAREHFTVVALIGVILLIGIVKKNAILMIDVALAAERGAGLPPVTAIRLACLRRFRPIMMTTIAAVLGAVPLAIGGAEGAELRHPLGIAVIGGLLVSQGLTLYSTPVIYLLFEQLRRRVRPVRAAEPAS